MYIVRKTTTQDGGASRYDDVMIVEDIKTLSSDVNYFNDTTNSDERHSVEIIGSIYFNSDATDDERDAIIQAVAYITLNK
jgi:exo-beta-1,3-glucanase (GH17 family)